MQLLEADSMKGAIEPHLPKAAYYKKREGLELGALNGTLLQVSLSASYKSFP